MGSILITGVTGYLGSSLAAGFLKSGQKVFALSRNDEDGSRSREAIVRASTGFGFTLTQEELSNLVVLDSNLEALAVELDSGNPELTSDLNTIQFAWHCAAEMSFSFKKYLHSYESNTRNTHAIYCFLEERCKNLQRLFYVSTAYVSGLEMGNIPEEMHSAPKFVNPYQISKWCTELSLQQLVTSGHKLPVTIFRPSIVVGHSQSGWYGGKCFGLYMFLDGWRLALALGSRKFNLDIKPYLKQNFVTIDEVVENAMRLSDRRIEQKKLEIVHCTGSQVSSQLTVDVASRIMGFKASFAPPMRPTDFLVDRFISANKPFAVANDFPFVQNRLSELLGENWKRIEIDRAVLRILIEGYLSVQEKVGEGSLSRSSKGFFILYKRLNERGVGRYIKPYVGKKLGETMLGRVMLPMLLKK